VINNLFTFILQQRFWNSELPEQFIFICANINLFILDEDYEIIVELIPIFKFANIFQGEQEDIALSWICNGKLIWTVAPNINLAENNLLDYIVDKI
jgi:hypothetical protein